MGIYALLTFLSYWHTGVHIKPPSMGCLCMVQPLFEVHIFHKCPTKFYVKIYTKQAIICKRHVHFKDKNNLHIAQLPWDLAW